MMVLGGLGLLYALFNLAVNIFGPAQNAQNNPFNMGGGGPNAQNNAGFQAGFMAGQIIGVSVTFIWSAMTFFGGLKMKSLTGYPFAIIGAICTMLPCNPCCLLGIPMGIWALVVLMRQDVKDAFS